MLYQISVRRKICRVLEFSNIRGVDRIRSLAPELIRQYLVPPYLRRDVYFGVLRYMLPYQSLENLEVMINEAYPKKEIYSEEAQAIITKVQVNRERI